MRARAALALIVAGLVAAMAGSDARATVHVKRLAYPARCIPADAAVGADGGLWLVCDQFPASSPYVVKVSTRGTVTRFGVLPTQIHGSQPVDTFGYPKLIAAPDGSAWISSGVGYVCRAAARTLRCAQTPEAASEPATHDAAEVYTGRPAAGPDGDLWFTQGPPDGHLPISVVRVRTDLQISESVVPDGLATPGELVPVVLGPDAAPWFGLGADHIARMAADGTIAWFDLAPDIADGNDVFAAAAAPGALVFATTRAGVFLIRRVLRIAPGGAQAVAYDVPQAMQVSALDPVEVDRAGAVWLAQRSSYPGISGSGQPAAIVRIDAAGARTRRTSRRARLGFLTRGPGGRIWAFAYGYRLARWRLITIDRRLRFTTVRTFAGEDGFASSRPRRGSVYLRRLVANDKALWVITGTNGRNDGPAPTGLQLIR